MRTFPGLGFDPAPGSVPDAEAVLARLAHVSSVVDGSADGLRRAARAGSWRGGAASAFRTGTTGLAGGLTDAVSALRSVSRAVSAWQSRLVANQREAEELESRARSLRGNPEAADELARVLDLAQRLRARHVRQAAEAAAAVRSGAAAGWPAESAAQLSGQVTRWTGDLAAGLVSPVWPPVPAPAGWPVTGPDLPGEEGWPGLPGQVGLGLPDLPGGPVPLLPGLDLPLPGRPDLLPGVLPVGSDGTAVPHLPALPLLPDGTAPAGWLDTGTAAPVRTPLDQLPVRPLPDTATSPALSGQLPHGLDRPAGPLPGRPVQVETGGEPARPAPHVRDAVRHEVQARPAAVPERTGGAARGVAPVRPEGHEPHARPEAETSGRGGAAHGPDRLGGHAALGGPAGGPGGHAGTAAPAGPHAGAGGSSPAGAPPPQPAPAPPAPPPAPGLADRPIGATVEQAVQPAAPPDAPDPGRAAADPARPGPDAGRGADRVTDGPRGYDGARGPGDPAAGRRPGHRAGHRARPRARPGHRRRPGAAPAGARFRPAGPGAGQGPRRRLRPRRGHDRPARRGGPARGAGGRSAGVSADPPRSAADSGTHQAGRRHRAALPHRFVPLCEPLARVRSTITRGGPGTVY